MKRSLGTILLIVWFVSMQILLFVGFDQFLRFKTPLNCSAVNQNEMRFQFYCKLFRNKQGNDSNHISFVESTSIIQNIEKIITNLKPSRANISINNSYNILLGSRSNFWTFGIIMVRILSIGAFMLIVTMLIVQPGM